MVPELQERDDPLTRKLEAALQNAESEDARYHIREALQLRIGERNENDDRR